MENRELVIELFCPTGQDAYLISEALRKEHILSSIVHTSDELLSKRYEDMDVILIAEEALVQNTIERLNKLLLTQEPWSEIPVILLTSKGARSRQFYLKPLEDFIFSGNVTLLERPLQPLTLLSAVKVAVRARKKQYQVRELLLSQMEATKIRDEFISIASHELKTPLTSLKLQTQVSQRTFRKTGLDPDKMFKQLDYTVNQINRLDRLVDDMLDISRISSGKLKIEKREMNLSKLIQDMVERFLPQFEAAGCEVRTNIEDSVTGSWDTYKVEQVINNLFSNAIRYAPKSAVEVTLKSIDDRAEFSVRDEGQGIDSDSLERIFDRFERASSNASGLGLGLYITRQIIELHDGTIKVESELGHWTCFTISMPLHALI